MLAAECQNQIQCKANADPNTAIFSSGLPVFYLRILQKWKRYAADWQRSDGGQIILLDKLTQPRHGRRWRI